MFGNWDAREEFTCNRCYFFQKAYFKYKFKCSYGRSGKTNIRTESKTTTKAKYKEREIDAFSPQWMWLKDVFHARKETVELLEFVLITTQTWQFNFKNWQSSVLTMYT